MEFVFSGPDQSEGQNVAQFLNRMSGELGQCVDWYATVN
jgi:hypothetical protein